MESLFWQYAKETQHEKILRGLALGIALTMYSRLEEADALIESLCLDKDPILRWSGMFTLAMAYCGSGSNQAIRKLLHVAVSNGLIYFLRFHHFLSFLVFYSIFFVQYTEIATCMFGIFTMWFYCSIALIFHSDGLILGVIAFLV